MDVSYTTVHKYTKDIKNETLSQEKINKIREHMKDGKSKEEGTPINYFKLFKSFYKKLY